MQKKETFKCQKCQVLNPLAKNAFQSVSCFACGTKHAITKGRDGAKEFHPFYDQERPKKGTGTSTVAAPTQSGGQSTISFNAE